MAGKAISPFDEAKYKALLEGLEISEISKSDAIQLTLSFRIDSEFFKREYLNDDKLFAKIGFEKLVKITRKINVGYVGSMVEYYRPIGINLLQTKNIDAFFINENNVIKITPEFHQKLNKSQIKYEDILIARSGSFGKASIYLEQSIINSSDIILVESNKQLINPYFLVTYLNSKFGINQMIRFSSGGLQGHVNLTILEELQVPKIVNEFQNQIEYLLKLSYQIKSKSKNAYLDAENILLNEIGLQSFTPCQDAVNIKSFKESFGTTKRLDAEYYQKKYDVLENKLLSQQHRYIKDIRTDNFRGLQPIYNENGNLQVINSKHILETSLDYDNFERTDMAYWEKQDKARVYKGDILTYTTGANIGRTQVYLKDEKALASNHVNIIRLKDENPFYIGFVLNSIVGRMQTEKRSAGSAQAELYPKDLDEFIIPIIDNSQQLKIVGLIEESFKLKAESERFLDVAKNAVEMAIEVDEEVAIRFIEENK